MQLSSINLLLPKWRGPLVNGAQFPSVALVKSWYRADKKSTLGSYREQAFNAYKNCLVQLPTTVCSRFITARCNWDRSALVGTEQGYKDLGNGAWSSDIAYAYTNHADSKRYIDKLFLNLENYSALQLLALACGSITMVYVPAYAHVELVRTQLFSSESHNLSISAVLCIVGERAQVLYTDGNNALALGAHVSSLWGSIAPQASVSIIQSYALSSESYVYEHESWSLESSARLSIVKGVTGGAISSLEYDFMLEGAQASVSCNLVAALKENQQNSFRTRQYHNGEKTESSVSVKTVLYDTSRACYDGTIMGSKEAQNMHADQQQRSLLLSDTVRVCAVPSLEIKTKEVQCRHGSAVGRVNSDHVWYLQSRGLTGLQAQKFLVDAFLEDSSLKNDCPIIYKSVSSVIQQIKNYCL